VSFSSDVSNWAKRTEARTLAVFQTAAQDLIEEAQTPRAKGGNMPIDFGFLRNSGQAALNDIPSGPSSPNNMTAAPLVISRAKIGDRVVFGWTANYAVYMEARYGFMRLAAQKWRQFVLTANKKVQK
jgi:hypothetical protein